MTKELLTRVVPDGEPKGWWAGYRERLADAGLSESARSVIELDCEYIHRLGVFGAGDPEREPHRWPDSRLRRGLVVGSVQSGKTASLLGVIAKGLDGGVDVVVLLTGTRLALWRQTLDRTLEQLDGLEPTSSGLRDRSRMFIPDPAAVMSDSVGRWSPRELYDISRSRFRRSLDRRDPLLAVVMKNADHLMAFGSQLRAALESALRKSERPLHVLVIDDEADDGSILDAEVESSLGPGSDALKLIPRHINRIWSDHGTGVGTFHDAVYCTYLAYTATPQANLLQSDHNPLSPRDFVVSLRTPFDSGTVQAPRAVTFTEPRGVSAYYTGGESFYRRLGSSAGLCHAVPFLLREEYESEDDFERAVLEQQMKIIGDGLRDFFVAAAMRLMHSGRRLSRAVQASPGSREEILDASPSPCSMLVHPSARIERHFEVARLIANWSIGMEGAGPDFEGYPQDSIGRPAPSSTGLEERLLAEEPLWEAAFRGYEETRQLLDKEFPGHGFTPNMKADWDRIKHFLVAEIFPHLRLSVINSDPESDDRPIFRPRRVADYYEVAPDLLTIFVSGSVMARGVTLDGLTTTVFLRGSNTPAADTQMQMQRWFGYRGSHLYWCRVYLYEDQLDLYRSYHENDEALKERIIGEMNRSDDKAPSPTVLQGAQYRATNKIANLTAFPLSPGRQPFVRVLDASGAFDGNTAVLAQLMEKYEWDDVRVPATLRGLICQRRFTLREVAELLESFRFENHSPDPRGRNHRRWLDLALELDLQKPIAPLFRPPPSTGGFAEIVHPGACPYTIAAYLRLWKAALSRPVRGLYPTDNARTPWSMVSLAEYAADEPSFYVGVRFGQAGPATNPALYERGVQRVKRIVDLESGLLGSTWGSRNPGRVPGAYLGDHLFDYHVSGLTPPDEVGDETRWRPRGHPGLLLFHLIDLGKTETLTAGVCLPIGGPDRFAALAPGGA